MFVFAGKNYANANDTVHYESLDTSYVVKDNNNIYFSSRYAAHGAFRGLKETTKGIGIGLKKASQGTSIGMKEASNETGIGVTASGYGVTTGIGKADYNESKFFYQPCREIDRLDELIFEEKSIEVERNIKIYTYFFRSKKPKANIFFIHGKMARTNFVC